MENVQTSSSLVDIEEIRKNAARSLDQGAVTSDYPLDLEMAYKILNAALATEILCVLRYRHHQIAAKGIDFPQVAAEFEEHALSEESHVMMIAERIDQLGGKADFNPAHASQNAVTEFGQATDLLSMIREDLVAERIVIEVYRKNIQFFGNQDPTSRRMLEQILADEEEHATDLADLLVRVDRHRQGLNS